MSITSTQPPSAQSSAELALSNGICALPRALRIGAWSFHWRPWLLSITLMLSALAFFTTAASIGSGEYPISPFRVIEILLGSPANKMEHLVVTQWRLPRALTGAIVGAALALAGAMFQNITRNPLASPDLLGVTTGASAGAVTVIVLGASSNNAVVLWLAGIGVPLAAFLGALITSLVIWALAWRKQIDTLRLVLFGIVVSALLHAYIRYLMIRAQIRDATTAQVWLSGSLSNSTWERVLPAAVIVCLILPLLGWIAFRFQAFALGDLVATSLGIRMNTFQALVLGLGVLLTAVAVAAAGPVNFIAFVAPQLAKRLCRTTTPPLLASALSGCVLLQAADIATHYLPRALPVGLLTSALGGVFLIYLLLLQRRKVNV